MHNQNVGKDVVLLYIVTETKNNIMLSEISLIRKNNYYSIFPEEPRVGKFRDKNQRTY